MKYAPTLPTRPRSGTPAAANMLGEQRKRGSCCDSDACAGSLGGETASPDVEEEAQEPLATREMWARDRWLPSFEGRILIELPQG